MCCNQALLSVHHTTGYQDVNKKYGNTIIIVTHNDAIKNMADRVITLRDGRIRKNYVNDNKIPAADLEW